ncbi:uncharacterized protein LOC130590197 [Beta vulgaris subsp. vulgaris]|uniref:uncharacterized protein LOC130590197 n=1 Tax=Beta vulgaris subsp. vulgaris TaxID=3555 RepID=UPI0025467C79|nr:uncharacterized protein LOC130590197 [Beta vulgaris subsp. vulgaris]
MYRFTKHLSIFRNQIKRWCLDHKVVWGIDWRELSTKLAATVTHISTHPQGNDFMLQRQQELDTSALAHSYWSQRSKDKYVQLGDLPTKFFYNKMRQKQRSAYIYLFELQITSGLGWSYHSNTILHHFKTAYGPSQGSTVSDQGQDEAIDLVLRDLNLPHLSLSQQQQLLRPFSKAKVHEAMLGIGQGKSPGLDGSTAEFFKLHWDSLGNEVFQAVNHFFTTGFILHEWNQTLLVLLPKGQNPEESAFIPGRHMDDNILISHELTHVLNKHRSGNVHLAALKIDMNKAYDRVNWRFLLKVLQAYGFPGQWIQLISQCISTVSYRILVNGQVTESFPSHCGLHQGDPLSPYLFLLCMDIFSRMISWLRIFDYSMGSSSQRITAWNHSPISQAGKLMLINHVLIASIAHILSVFLIPTTIANKLDAMLARFFWSNSSGKGIAWKSKELLHLQKGAGGLGLRSIGDAQSFSSDEESLAYS